jgi:hypothetical protein
MQNKKEHVELMKANGVTGVLNVQVPPKKNEE